MLWQVPCEVRIPRAGSGLLTFDGTFRKVVDNLAMATIMLGGWEVRQGSRHWVPGNRAWKPWEAW